VVRRAATHESATAAVESAESGGSSEAKRANAEGEEENPVAKQTEDAAESSDHLREQTEHDNNEEAGVRKRRGFFDRTDETTMNGIVVEPLTTPPAVEPHPVEEPEMAPPHNGGSGGGNIQKRSLVMRAKRVMRSEYFHARNPMEQRQTNERLPPGEMQMMANPQANGMGGGPMEGEHFPQGGNTNGNMLNNGMEHTGMENGMGDGEQRRGETFGNEQFGEEGEEHRFE